MGEGDSLTLDEISRCWMLNPKKELILEQNRLPDAPSQGSAAVLDFKQLHGYSLNEHRLGFPVGDFKPLEDVGSSAIGLVAYADLKQRYI